MFWRNVLNLFRLERLSQCLLCFKSPQTPTKILLLLSANLSEINGIDLREKFSITKTYCRCKSKYSRWNYNQICYHITLSFLRGFREIGYQAKRNCCIVSTKSFLTDTDKCKDAYFDLQLVGGIGSEIRHCMKIWCRVRWLIIFYAFHRICCHKKRICSDNHFGYILFIHSIFLTRF